jgi:hypothetical protein
MFLSFATGKSKSLINEDCSKHWQHDPTHDPAGSSLNQKTLSYAFTGQPRCGKKIVINESTSNSPTVFLLAIDNETSLVDESCNKHQQNDPKHHPAGRPQQQVLSSVFTAN